MGRVTYGDVIAGAASKEELVPFGGDRAHKAFALAVGLQLLVDSLAGDGEGDEADRGLPPAHGAVLPVARPRSDPSMTSRWSSVVGSMRSASVRWR
jgi:hypothetical protein